MHLIYLDESGNTGTDLKDTQQPVFVLAALIVPETCWQQLEVDLETSFKTLLPATSFEGVEVHGSDLRGGRGSFKGHDLNVRIGLRDEWLKIAQKHLLKVVYRAIVKKRFEQWMHQTFGAGVKINPHVAAFALVARVVDEYLAALPGKALGMFISDENKEIVHDVEKSIKVLRGAAGTLRLGQIVENRILHRLHEESRAAALRFVCFECPQERGSEDRCAVERVRREWRDADRHVGPPRQRIARGRFSLVNEPTE